MGADAPEHASVARGTNGLVRPDGPRKVPARPYGCRLVKGGYDADMNAAYEREGFFRTAWGAVATVGALIITLTAGAAFVVFWAAVIAGVTWLAVQVLNALGEFLG